MPRIHASPPPAGQQQARAEAQQCREEKARLQAECSGQGGLTDLIANGWLGETGVVARWLKDVTQRPGGYLVAKKVISYRAVGPDGRGQMAVEVVLLNLGSVAWMPSGAALVGAKREELTGLTVWPLEPIPPGESLRIVVELNATESEARGSYTLNLWAEEAGAGGRESQWRDVPIGGGPDGSSAVTDGFGSRRR